MEANKSAEGGEAVAVGAPQPLDNAPAPAVPAAAVQSAEGGEAIASPQSAAAPPTDDKDETSPAADDSPSPLSLDYWMGNSNDDDHTSVVYDRYITSANRALTRSTSHPLSAEHKEELYRSLRGGSLFKFCSEDSIERVAKKMKRVPFQQGDVLMEQGEPQARVFLIAKGSVSRLRYINDQLHQVETIASAPEHRGMFGALHVLRQEPTYATALAETDGVAYTLDSKHFHTMLEEDSVLAKEVIYSLSKEIFRMSKLRTPLLEQDPKPNNVIATSIGAIIESYYRSGLNALLNAALTGSRPAALFPNFHIQIPSRVLYINGFKTVRQYLTENVDPTSFAYPTATRLGLTCVPGLCMTPVSSVLEACNADHMNSEPLLRRITRGLLPRSLREVIFGIGINQLSDACEERVAYIENAFMRTAVGSMTAGSIAGYLSHIPHNLSTLKLLQPHRSYGDILRKMVDDNMKSAPEEWMPGPRRMSAAFVTFFLPKGCLLRTAQICGSFMIINGAINIFAATSDSLGVEPEKRPLRRREVEATKRL